MQLHLRKTENEFRDMTEETEQETPTLEGEAALELWRQGRSAWNTWIDQHQGWNISFADVDFFIERDSDGNLSFEYYHFGTGDVNFSGATFGDGNVSFWETKFGQGAVDFSKVTFGNGNVNFTAATFGDGNINFKGANFGNGDVDFTAATFSNGEVKFSWTMLGNGEMNFSNTTFGDCTIYLNEANLSQLRFLPKAIKSGHIKAQGLSIKSLAVFILPSSADTLKSFDLYGASLEGPLIFAGNLNIVPDLRATKSAHQVELSALKVELPRKWRKLSWPPKFSRVAEDKEDGAALRRLKEIAETNKDHQAALRFSADENRAKRWIETSWFGSVLDMAFSAFSNYGQSILRPSFWLGLIFALSMYAYKAKQLPKLATDGWADWAQAALLSASNGLPFLPQSRDLREDALMALYGTTDPSLCVDLLMITQGALSFVFLFLIGLGLRNRFRL